MHEAIRRRSTDHDERVVASLEAALAEARPSEKDFHIRTALQHLVIAAEAPDADRAR